MGTRTPDLCRVKVQLSNTSNHSMFGAKLALAMTYRSLRYGSLRHGYISALGRDAKVHPQK